jgi:hypothetical protein
VRVLPCFHVIYFVAFSKPTAAHNPAASKKNPNITGRRSARKATSSEHAFRVFWIPFCRRDRGHDPT